MRNTRIGIVGVVMLIALRLSLGWHFYMEGVKKLQHPGFTSTHLLRQATGPLAPFYHGMIPDKDGRERLDQAATIKTWDLYRARAAKHFHFNDQQKEDAAKVLEHAESALEFYFAYSDDDLTEYYNEKGRLESARNDRGTRDVAYRKTWMLQKETELAGKLSGLLNDVDKLWDGYERDLHAVAEPEQLSAHGHYPLRRPGEKWLDTRFVDQVIPYFILIVGVCLLLGLFTRTASVAGALFLLSVIVSQPPWVFGAEETFYPTAEMMSLLVLAAVGAGRFAGIDFFLHAMCIRCCGTRKRGTNHESDA